MLNEKIEELQDYLEDKIAAVVTHYINEIEKNNKTEKEKLKDLKKLMYIYDSLESAIIKIDNLKIND